jgi:hypothetical protein
MPFCRPTPLSLYPPKGTSRANELPPLIEIDPTRSRAATAEARESDADEIAADNPYGVPLAISTASSSSS